MENQPIFGQTPPQGTSPTPPPAKPKPNPNSLRTFRTDVQTQVEENNLSLATIAQKEDERRQTLRAQAVRVPTKSSPTALYLGIGTAALVLMGAVGWGIFSLFFAQNEPGTAISTQNRPLSLVFAEKTQEIDVGGVKNSDELAALTTKAISTSQAELGSILQLFFTLKNQGETAFVGAPSFFGAAFANAPENFRRSLGENFMFGAYMGNKPNPFLILETPSYEIARAGLLAWEPFMCQDLAKLFQKADCVGQTDASWTDDMVRNTDVRELRDTNGHMILIYAFIGRNTVIIAQNQSGFIELLTRYHTPRPVIR